MQQGGTDETLRRPLRCTGLRRLWKEIPDADLPITAYQPRNITLSNLPDYFRQYNSTEYQALGNIASLEYIY